MLAVNIEIVPDDNNNKASWHLDIRGYGSKINDTEINEISHAVNNIIAISIRKTTEGNETSE